MIEVSAMAEAGTLPPVARESIAGWLIKRKSDNATSRLLKSSNKRYFTLDFQAQIFHYAHSQNKKTISYPMPFRSMLSVESLALAVKEDGDAEVEGRAAGEPCIKRSYSKGSLTSFRMPKVPSLSSLSKRGSERHGFVLRTTDKSLELLCESKAEAESWIAALHEAIALGRSSPDVQSTKFGNAEMTNAELVSTSVGSSGSTTPRSSSHGSCPRAVSTPPAPPDTDREMQVKNDGLSNEKCPPNVSAGPAGSEPAVEKCPPNVPPAPVASELASPSDQADASNMISQVSDKFESSPLKGPYGSLCSGELQPMGASCFSPAASDAGCTEKLVPHVPPRSARSTSSCEKRSRYVQAAPAVSRVLPTTTMELEAHNGWGAVADGCTQNLDAASKYGDKAQGLSFNQRLSQLEFSDDEDSDMDEECRQASITLAKQVATQVPPAGVLAPSAPRPPHTESVNVEACECFDAADCSSDDD